MSGYLQGLIILVGINIIAVLGISILTGFTRLFSFGNAGFTSIGAYTAAILSLDLHVPFLLSVLAGGLLAGFIAFLLGKLTLNLQGDYFLIATLGFGESVRVLFNYLTKVTGGASGLAGIPTIPGNKMVVVVIFTILCIVVARNVIYSKFGRNIMAIREDEWQPELWVLIQPNIRTLLSHSVAFWRVSRVVCGRITSPTFLP
jgi:branched-chain amino acid transport system permease protein